MPRITAQMAGLDAALAAGAASIFQAVDDAVEAASDGLKADLREQTGAVLGGKVALTWRNRFYSNKGDPKGPAGFVWSKAPRIISFFSAERIVTPIGKAFAIPVTKVPGNRGRRATVADVEARFGKLTFVPFKDGNAGLFANLSRGSRSRRGKPQLTLMFVLVRTIRSAKLIDLEATAERWGGRIADDIGRALGD